MQNMQMVYVYMLAADQIVSTIFFLNTNIVNFFVCHSFMSKQIDMIFGDSWTLHFIPEFLQDIFCCIEKFQQAKAGRKANSPIIVR